MQPVDRYKQNIRELSEALVALQSPIRILNSIKWPQEIVDRFVGSDFKDVPKLSAASYAATELGFDPESLRRDFLELKARVVARLGVTDPAGAILSATCDQYATAVELLKHRGTPRFGELSKELYGSSEDTFIDGKTPVRELGVLMGDILAGISQEHLGAEFPKIHSAEFCVSELNRRFQDYFHADVVVSELSESLIADAAAGAATVKIRPDAKFSTRDIDILEVHEAWVHVGTTLNGAKQPWCTWLSKGAPRVTATQEGLAVMMEVFTFRTYPVRAKRINDRVLGISWAEQGANPCEVAERFRLRGHTVEEIRYNVGRIFRGTGGPGCGPFTKDLSYARGFVENYNFIRTAIGAGRMYVIPLMFCGKLTLQDIPGLQQLREEGILELPAYLPPQFADLNGLAVWMSFSNFFNVIDLAQVRDHYERMFDSFPPPANAENASAPVSAK